MNTERFIDLIDVLEGVKPETFGLSSWRCGTTACAVGHYCLARPEGELILVKTPYGAEVCLFDKTDIDSRDAYGGYGAAAVHFEIPVLDAVHLFDPREYSKDASSHGHVLARLKDFLFEKTGIDYHAHKAQARANAEPQYAMSK